MKILNIQHLHTEVHLANRHIPIIRDVSFSLEAGEIIGVAGESGSGKTMSMHSIVNLLPANITMTQGDIDFAGAAIDATNQKQLQSIRGSQVSYIFQDPQATLNPLLSIGEQISEVLIVHRGFSQEKAKQSTCAVLETVELSPGHHYYDYFPHQLSGGMNQRAMIAMAIIAQPKVLIADEPTSSLDKLTEQRILQLLQRINREMKIAIILISHNISLIQQIAQRILIMYAGTIVERGPIDAVLKHPAHPYTKALLACIPKQGRSSRKRLQTISGSVPEFTALPSGCPFHPRCPSVMKACPLGEPRFRQVSVEKHEAKCYLR